MAGAPLIVILGPTATGKSEVAVSLARRIGGGIISADSIQVYRGLEAGSCKPPLEARREIPHALIDVADPREAFSAGRFARMALEAIASFRAEGRVPIVAGGTGLYIRALLEGIAPMPPRDEAVRAALYARASAGSTEDLHRELAARDPETARRIGPRDLQRIVRALEVLELTGIPLSRHIERDRFRPGSVSAAKVGLSMERAALHRRVDGRVDRIFASGIVEEVRGLIEAGLPPGANALKALGYREVVAHLSGGADLAHTIDLVKRNTRRYARRQITWFRREADVGWHDAGLLSADAIAARVADGLAAGPDR